MNTSRKISTFAIIIALLVSQFAGSVSASSLPQQTNPNNRADQLLQRMTPEEKIGQLFLLETIGTDAGPDSLIYDLIVNHYISGVLLSRDNDNFTYGSSASQDLMELTNSFQRVKYNGAQREQINPFNGEFFTPVYIPMFVGITQDGDGYPMDDFLGTEVSLPSYMALAATWEPDYAYESGVILGELLDAWGINLLLGPSLDIVDNPNPNEALINAIGTRTFGGDPFWVSEMARAFTEGIHTGYSSDLLIVGKHFPGLGSADRLPDQEVSTVRRTLDQLEQIELEPFFALTGEASSEAAELDGLLTTHIRYQGLQGNIRATTRPINFDAQALDLLFSLPGLASWRESGGLLVSDDLNSLAVKNFYDPTETGFNIRRPALDAFLAGNDLLILGLDEELSDDYDSYYLEILETLDFFTQKYREDPEFASRVDEAVMRILIHKYEIFELFTISQVVSTTDELSDVQYDALLPIDIARNSATLISPSTAEISNIFPDTPENDELIAIFTDAYRVKPCSECDSVQTIPINALENSIINLYGPDSGGRIQPNAISSYDYTELTRYLNGEELTSLIELHIERADWLVFVTQDISEDRPTSNALTRLLNERPEIIQDKMIVVFSTSTPTILDSTSISKINAYYALYSKSQPFIDVAARLLFKEIITPQGASPISIPGIGYYLEDITQPDPNRLISLLISETSAPDSFFIPETTIEVNEDTALYVKTSEILDMNGNIVPDGTPVIFRASIDEQELVLAEVTTEAGVAVISLQLPGQGLFRLSVLTANVQSEEIDIVKLPVETAETILTEELTTPTSSPEPTNIPIIETIETQIPPITPPSSILIDRKFLLWSLSVLISLVTGFVAYNSANIVQRYRNRYQWGLAAIIGGLIGYIYIYLELPGVSQISDNTDWFLLVSVLITALFGWGIAVLISYRLREN